MNMQGAVAALASLNHSQATASVANAGQAQAGTSTDVNGAQGFSALLQMLMGTTATSELTGTEATVSESQVGELGEQLAQIMQMLESDPQLAKMVQAGDKTQLDPLLGQKGIDLEELNSDLQELIGTDVVTFVTELMPKMDSSQLLQALSLGLEEGNLSKDQSIDARVNAASLNNPGLEKDVFSSEGIDPKLQDLIGEKIKELSSGTINKADDQNSWSNGPLASAMDSDELSASQKQNNLKSASNENSDLLLSQKGMELMQKMNLNAGNSANDNLVDVLPKGESASKLNLGSGLFSDSIKQATDSVIAKVASVNSGLTTNIDQALNQGSNIANQVHFNVQSPTATSASALPKSQFSMIGDTVDQVQGLAKDMAMQIKAGDSEIRIAIKPEHLGEMMVKVSVESSGINLDMKVENAEVKQVFDASLQQLKDNLAQNGIKVSNANVDIQQQDMSEQNKSRFFNERKGANNSKEDDFEQDLIVDDVVQRNENLQSRVYAQTAYGVNYFA